jgi:homoserine O-acetyltransferase
VLGGCQGTTGPSSPAAEGRPYGSRFPRITVPDQVAVESRLADALGIRRWASVVGGSMGGMRALEWVAGSPDRVASALVLAVGAVASADQIATQTTQNLAITSDPGWRGGDYHDGGPGEGPWRGLGVARRIAHLTYRSEVELDLRFGNDPQDGEDPLGSGRWAVQSYLDHQAEKLAHRFDAGSYVALTDAMSTWDLGRGRGRGAAAAGVGVDAALASIRVPLVVGGVDSDRLYPIHQQQRIADLAPGCVDGLRVIPSPYGHDGFLVEREQVFELVAETLDLSDDVAA